MTKEELKVRTKNLVISIFKFIEKLPKSKSNVVISYQLLKSSSSVAANYKQLAELNQIKIF